MFRTGKLTKDDDPHENKYNSYSIGSDGSMGKNVIFSLADMGLSVHIDNEEKDIWLLGKGTTQRLDETTLSAEAQYSNKFV